MKLTPISLNEVYEEAYEDYCADTNQPLSMNEWLKTDEADVSIQRFCALLGIRRAAQ